MPKFRGRNSLKNSSAPCIPQQAAFMVVWYKLATWSLLGNFPSQNHLNFNVNISKRFANKGPALAITPAKFQRDATHAKALQPKKQLAFQRYWSKCFFWSLLRSSSTLSQCPPTVSLHVGPVGSEPAQASPSDPSKIIRIPIPCN